MGRAASERYARIPHERAARPCRWCSPDAHRSPRCRSWRSVHERERVPRHVRVWHDRRATVIVEKGLVEVSEPVTVVRLDTPAGLVAAHVRGRAWITGTAEFTLDPSDPFPTGFKFGS